MEITKKFKASVCQVSPCPKPDMLKKIDKYATEAASKGARIILFPEASIGGYPRGNSFDCNIGYRGEKGHDHSKIDAKFHLQIALCAKNDFLMSQLFSTLFFGISYLVASSDHELYGLSETFHNDLFEAMLTRDASRARSCMAEHQHTNMVFLNKTNEAYAQRCMWLYVMALDVASKSKKAGPRLRAAPPCFSLSGDYCSICPEGAAEDGPFSSSLSLPSGPQPKL